MWELDVYLLYTIGIPQHSHYFSCVEWIAVELLFIKSTHNVRTLKTTTTMTTSKPNKTYKSLHRNSLFLFEVRNLPGMYFFSIDKCAKVRENTHNKSEYSIRRLSVQPIKFEMNFVSTPKKSHFCAY